MRWMMLWVALAVNVLGCSSSNSQTCNVDADCTQPLPSGCTPALAGAGNDGGTSSCHWFCSEGLCEVSS
jgi:hypothetical protein